MKIEHFHIHGFGKHQDVKSGADTNTLNSLVVVEGTNEAGKSTLFHFFQTVLYGFHPANKRDNPYFPWESDEASGSARVRLDNGDSFAIERTLRSKPEGHVTGADGTKELLANNPLQWIDEKHLPLNVFQKVFQITLRDLAALDPDGAGAKDQQKKDRETWERFQGLMSEWIGAVDLEPPRDVARDLEKEAGEIWRTTRRGDQDLRDLEDEDKELREKEREAVENETKRREVDTQLNKVRNHYQDLGQEGRDLRRKVDTLNTLISLSKQIETKETDISNFDENAKRLCSSEDTIKELVVDTRYTTNQSQITSLEKNISEQDSKLEREAAEVFDQSWSEASISPETLSVLNIDQLRNQVASRPSAVEVFLGRTSSTVIATVLALVSLLSLGYSTVSFAPLAVVVLSLFSRRRTAKYLAGTASLLKGIPIKEACLSSPGEKTLYQPLTLLKELVAEQEQWAHTVKGLKESRDNLVIDIDQRTAELIDKLGQPFESTSELEDALKQANILRHDADKAKGELQDISTKANRLKQDLGSDLEDLPEADTTSERLSTHLAKFEELQSENDEARETRHEQVTSLEVEKAKLDELKTASALRAERDALKEKKHTLQRERDRKWVIAQLIREADRLFRERHGPGLLKKASAYLKNLTGGRYNVLEMAGHTGDGGADSQPLFQLGGPALPTARNPQVLGPPISTATLEQAYLSLRLATVDYMDQERERLPLFIDEAFVNWDPVRRQRGLEVLSELSSSRQIFVFTCHSLVADLLKNLGGQVLKLGS